MTCSPQDLWSKDFLNYLRIIFRERLFSWIPYVITAMLFWKKCSRFIAIRKNDQIVGGFLITNMPIPRYYLYYFFDRQGYWKMKKFRNQGYQCLCCFVVGKSARSQGLGTITLQKYLKEHSVKLYFTIYPGTKDFYIRNGARQVLFYNDLKYDIFVLDLNYDR